MGYTTEFRGAIELQPALSADQIKQLKKLADTRHGGNIDTYAGFPSLYCQWVPTDDGKGLVWDGGEKFYSSPEWMQLILDRYITPWGIKASGTILAQGEDMMDRWKLVVKANKVTTRKARG